MNNEVYDKFIGYFLASFISLLFGLIGVVCPIALAVTGVYKPESFSLIQAMFFSIGIFSLMSTVICGVRAYQIFKNKYTKNDDACIIKNGHNFNVITDFLKDQHFGDYSFEVKSLKNWRFGFWVTCDEKRNLCVDLFAQWIPAIDKFKPSRSVYSTSFKIHNTRNIKFLDEDFINDLNDFVDIIVRDIKRHGVFAPYFSANETFNVKISLIEALKSYLRWTSFNKKSLKESRRTKKLRACGIKKFKDLVKEDALSYICSYKKEDIKLCIKDLHYSIVDKNYNLLMSWIFIIGDSSCFVEYLYGVPEDLINVESGRYDWIEDSNKDDFNYSDKFRDEYFIDCGILVR